MMRRLRIALLLVLALLAAPLAPVRAAWFCPDGTPCAADSGGYRCASDACGPESCCVELSGPRCRHGALPGPEPDPGEALAGPDHCRFTAAGAMDAAARQTPAAPRIAAPDGIVPRAGVPPPAAGIAVAFRAASAQGYRPPPLPSSGPSRAPPLT